MDSSCDVNKPNVMGYSSMNKQYPPAYIPPPGYPMAYQAGYVHPYQGYVSAPSSKSYASPSFNVMYGQSYGPWMHEQNNHNVHKFGRLMLGTMITLLVMMSMVTLVIWFLFGTEVPEFQVGSFHVSNFTTNNSTVQANWEVNMTVINLNTNLKVKSGPVQVLIIYKNFPLVKSLLDPFSVEGNQAFDLHFELDNVKRECGETLATEIRRDQSLGTIFLTLQLNLGARFASATIWRKESLKVYCEELQINLASNGNGALAEDSSKECLLFA